MALLHEESSSGLQTQIKFEAKRVKVEGSLLPPLREPATKLLVMSPIICSIMCYAMYSEGYCCSSFTISDSQKCQLRDVDPHLLEDSSKSSNQIVYLLTELIPCQVAFITGGWNNLKSVELYSPIGDCQYSLAPLPVDLLQHIVFRFEETIMACSGYTSTIVGNENKNCYQYDVQNNKWNTYLALQFGHLFGVGTVYQNKLYMFDSPNSEGVDLKTKTVIEPIPAPIPTGAGACTVIVEDSVLLIGGNFSRKMVQHYNFTSKTWTTFTPFQLDNFNFGCVLIPGSKHQVFSVADDHPSDLVFTPQPPTIYDASKHVVNARTHQKVTRVGNSLVALGTKILLIGGYNNGNVAIVEEYHLDSNTWTTKVLPLKVARHYSRSVSVPASWFSKLPGGCGGVH